MLALPFSILRVGRLLAGRLRSRVKEIAIRELGMGTNSKLHVQFTTRLWATLGYNGDDVRRHAGTRTPGR